MPTPRNSTQSRATSSRSAIASTNDIHFLENEASVPVQAFLDEKVLAYEGGKFIDFRYDQGESKRGKNKVSFLTVKMPKMRIEDEALVPDDKVDENGEITQDAPMVSVTIRASYDANEVLMKQKGKPDALKGINVSAFHATDQETGKETGEVGYILTVASGESADLNTLGLRF